ncbi:MAG: TlpA family protein disulfide reductase [Candidatus Tectimicrobiota bacterium]
MRALAILGVFVVACLSGSAVGSQMSTVQASPPSGLLLQPGQPAPAFRSRDPQGNAIALHDYRGRPVIVNFWATWCAPCRQEMRALQAIYELYQAAGLVVLALSQDQDESAELVRAYWSRMALTFLPLLDTDGRVATHYSVFMLPSTVFIYPSGTIAAVHLGPLTQGQIEHYLKAILAQAD